MYVSFDQACDLPSSSSPVSAADYAAQNAAVSEIAASMVSGNAAVFGPVQQLGGVVPVGIPGAPSNTVAAAPPVAAPVVYAAPGVPAAPAWVPLPAIGQPKTGMDLGLAWHSAARVGCAGLGDAANPGAGAPSGASDVISSGWFWGALFFGLTLWALGSQGAYRK